MPGKARKQPTLRWRAPATINEESEPIVTDPSSTSMVDNPSNDAAETVTTPARAQKKARKVTNKKKKTVSTTESNDDGNDDDNNDIELNNAQTKATTDADDLERFRNCEQHQFSLTISRLKDHIPRAWLDCMAEFAKQMLNDDDAAAFCLERGGKAENLHIQAMMSLRWRTDKAAVDYLKKLIKNALGIKYGDGMRWYVYRLNLTNDSHKVRRTCTT